MTEAEQLAALAAERLSAPALEEPDPEPLPQTFKRDIGALIAFVDGRRQATHVWGREANDCAGYCLAAVEAETGVRVAPELAWSNRAEALKVIKRFGSLEAAFDAYFERVAPAFAMHGDIGGVADDAFGVHPMIVEGATLVGPGDKGNRRVAREAMIVAWDATMLKRPPAAPRASPAARGRGQAKPDV